MLLIDQTGTVQLQRQRAFAIGFLCQQHAFDIGVFDDANLRLGSVFAPDADRTPLGPVLGVIQRRVITRHAEHGGRDADPDARLVHHVKHAAQAFARFAYQVTHSAGAMAVQATARARHRVFSFAKIQQRVGGTAPAQLVIQTGERHIVALTSKLTRGIHHFLGHDEQRDAAGARNQLAIRPRDLGQHQVDDVLGQLVFPGRYPHLVALEAIACAQRVSLRAFSVRRCAGCDIRQAGAGLRFAQAHGAGPAPGKLIFGKYFFLQRRAMHHQ